ncbi:MAG: AAA-like domain-containing protein [Armatimonadota bacterium]
MFGQASVQLNRPIQTLAKFRSRSAETLVFMLALRQPAGLSKEWMSENLWPNSDGDKQAQNLRKATSDARLALQDPESILGNPTRLSLNTNIVTTDIQEFRTHTDAGLSEAIPEVSLRAALNLYKGPLLPGIDEPWVLSHRKEMEERFGQSVGSLIGLLLNSSRIQDALLLGRHAVVAAPLREDIHIALMTAYASAGLKAEAIRQFEELEFLLENEWGEQPSQSAQKVMKDLEHGVKIGTNGKSRAGSGGAIHSGSPFYVARECDDQVLSALNEGENTILIHGPRQVGKTSLVAKVVQLQRDKRSTIVVSDFQVLTKSQIESTELFYKGLVGGFATQLGKIEQLQNSWSEWLGPNLNLENALKRVIEATPGHITWVMDEVDRIFDREYTDDFFGLVRSWHNRTALEPNGPFARFSVVIAYATEAHLFIKDINQSPFNIGRKVAVRDFSSTEVSKLAGRYGIDLSAEQTKQLFQLTSGHPFLTRRALDLIVNEGETLDQVRERSAESDGPFGDHLRRLGELVMLDQHTCNEVTRILKDQQSEDPKTVSRLISGGLLVQKNGKFEFRVPAYRAYLARILA